MGEPNVEKGIQPGQGTLAGAGLMVVQAAALSEEEILLPEESLQVFVLFLSFFLRL